MLLLQNFLLSKKTEEPFDDNHTITEAHLSLSTICASKSLFLAIRHTGGCLLAFTNTYVADQHRITAILTVPNLKMLPSPEPWLPLGPSPLSRSHPCLSHGPTTRTGSYINSRALTLGKRMSSLARRPLKPDSAVTKSLRLKQSLREEGCMNVFISRPFSIA